MPLFDFGKKKLPNKAIGRNTASNNKEMLWGWFRPVIEWAGMKLRAIYPVLLFTHGNFPVLETCFLGNSLWQIFSAGKRSTSAFHQMIACRTTTFFLQDTIKIGGNHMTGEQLKTLVLIVIGSGIISALTTKLLSLPAKDAIEILTYVIQLVVLIVIISMIDNKKAI